MRSGSLTGKYLIFPIWASRAPYQLEELWPLSTHTYVKPSGPISIGARVSPAIQSLRSLEPELGHDASAVTPPASRFMKPQLLLLPRS
jgi:hypothetical protein